MKIIKNLALDGLHHRPIVTDLFFKQSQSPKPIVLFCHGYKGFKDWGAWTIMAEQFANAGYFFVKFNFSHNGGTLEDPIDFPDLDAFANNTYSKEMDDLQAVINWLSSNNPYQTELNPEQLYLLGHSRGGGIVTLTAAQDPRIKKVVSLAGVCDYRSRFLEGTPHFEQWQKSGVTHVENTRTKQQLPHNFSFFQDFIANEQKLTIKTASQSITIPHLIVHGEADTSVTLVEAQNLHRWNPKSELYIVQDADHVFGLKHPWQQDSLSLHMELVMQKVLSFFMAPA
ncbi:MAG: alpha/beta fold hydrolase [Gilvibacter sp.]